MENEKDLKIKKSLSLGEKLFADAVERAKKEGRTFSNLVQVALRFYLKTKN